MAKTPAEQFTADWKRKRYQLAMWDFAAAEQENRVNKNPDIPTVEAVHSAICMAAILCRHGVTVDLMTLDRLGGIKFEKWSGRKEWRVAPDGSCDMLTPEGPDIRRVNVGGPLE